MLGIKKFIIYIDCDRKDLPF